MLVGAQVDRLGETVLLGTQKHMFKLKEHSGSVVECLTRGFEPHRRHCVVVLEQDTFILA